MIPGPFYDFFPSPKVLSGTSFYSECIKNMMMGIDVSLLKLTLLSVP